jgi:hypothetical protein
MCPSTFCGDNQARQNRRPYNQTPLIGGGEEPTPIATKRKTGFGRPAKKRAQMSQEQNCVSPRWGLPGSVGLRMAFWRALRAPFLILIGCYTNFYYYFFIIFVIALVLRAWCRWSAAVDLASLVPFSLP